MKINNDKYYTPIKTAKYCIDKTFEIIGKENVTEIIEPSAGNGAFSNQVENCIAYDIEPEDESVIKQDFLTLDLDYKKGRLFIGNPPFGDRLNLARQFYKKAVQLGDYIAFILPISQLDNNQSLYEFDLVYSEDLGILEYSDRELHCCFNIYKRNCSGKLNSKQSNKIDFIDICRYDSIGYDAFDYDIRMCYWGNGSAGKIIYDNNKTYAAEYKIRIHNDKYKQQIIDLLTNFNWKEYKKSISMLRISQTDIYTVIRDNVTIIEKSEKFIRSNLLDE